MSTLRNPKASGCYVVMVTVLCRELTERLLDVSRQNHRGYCSSSPGGMFFPLETDLLNFAFTAPQAAAPADGTLTVVSAGTVVVPGQQQGPAPKLAQHDDLSSLLEALASVYRVRPGLWHDREVPTAFGYVTSFMSHVSSCRRSISSGQTLISAGYDFDMIGCCHHASLQLHMLLIKGIWLRFALCW